VNPSSIVAALAWGGLAAGLVVWLVVIPIGLRGIFDALGVSPGRAWIPFANVANLFRLGGLSEYWIVALVIPGVNVVGMVMLIIASHRVTKRLGHNGAYTVLAVFVWWLWALVVGLQHRDVRAAEPLVWSVQQRPAPVVSLGGDNTRSTTPPAAPVPAAAPVPDEAPVADAPRPAPTFDSISLPMQSAPLAEFFAAGAAAGQGEQTGSTGPAEAVDPTGSPEPASPAQTASYPHHQLDPDLYAALFDRTAAPEPAPQGDAVPDDDATILTRGLDQTVISTRRRPRWAVETTAGAHVELVGTVAILGRRPAGHPLYPAAQLITVTDPATSVSATHAALEFLDGEWQVTDLGSTNGVWVVDAGSGAERELGAHNRTSVTGRFLLGELGVQVVRDA